MNNGIQVVTIGNAFELVYRHVEAYRNLSELARVDECHFGQKAAFWSTRHGQSSIVICTSAPSDWILSAIYEDQPQPTYIEPRRASSSICLDLLNDSTAFSKLLTVLNRNKKVYLAPYVHTSHVERLGDFLMDMGYDLVDYRHQAELVELLWDKVNAQQVVFQPVNPLCNHRPKSIIAYSENDLLDAIASFARQDIEKVVVKSSAAVGGAGVFFLDSRSIKQGSSHQDFLLEVGQNEADRSAPFLVEERVQSDASPTVDIEVTQTGQVEVVGIALQRLYDGRYYTGFYSSPVLEERWWFRVVETLARIVGHKLAELGYLGPANVDFVVSLAEHRVTLVEINPRRSALIDGFSLRKMKYASLPNTSISVADYVNISGCFITLQDAFGAFVAEDKLSAPVLPVADGGFASRFRWTGVVAVGVGSVDSEDILEEAVLQLQDPERDEIGLAEHNVRSFGRVTEKVA
jgi:hypothetical protein